MMRILALFMAAFTLHVPVAAQAQAFPPTSWPAPSPRISAKPLDSSSSSKTRAVRGATSALKSCPNRQAMVTPCS